MGCELHSEVTVSTDPVKPYLENPYYWQFNGEPILLIGGSQEDNLFNHPDLAPDGLEAHLDLLLENGINYLRNTMSSRNPDNRYPFREMENGLYDLSEWDEEYWERFEHFLDMTFERGIIVQLEFWDPWDMYKSEGEGVNDFRAGNKGWESHPYNPVNNVNYNSGDSGLTDIDFFPSAEPTTHSLFHTVPEMDNNRVVLPYQEMFVEKILAYTLRYPHILYCINNETGEDVKWGDYWIRFVNEKAEKAGVEIYITDMRRNEQINGPDHRFIHDQPEIYTFIEISQNNGHSVSGQQHYDAILELRAYLEEIPRPMNNIKIYGGADGWGGTEEGLQKFWRNLFAGSASARFHRPPAGLGFTEMARNHLKSIRMITDEVNFFRAVPSNELLSDRNENEAYLLAEPGRSYLVYFPGSGSVTLDLSGTSKEFQLRWLDVSTNEWVQEAKITGDDKVILETPGSGHQVAVIK